MTERAVLFGFTAENIAYLNERMKLAHKRSPMPRVGGSSLKSRSNSGSAG